MNKNEMVQLLADNEVDKVFGLLRNRLDTYRDLVLLEGQWRDLQSRARSGVISTDQANLEAAKVRKGLLEIIDMSDSPTESFAMQGGVPYASRPQKSPTSFWLFLGAGLLFVSFLAIWAYRSLEADSPLSAQEDTSQSSTQGNASVIKKAAKARTLTISAATPLTFAAGSGQYERVYSVIEGKVESIGGGKSLVVLKVVLNFNGSINFMLGSDGFRLIAPELRGPVPPSNFFADVVDSKSFMEVDVKFEIADTLTRFSVFLEGKEDRKWDFRVE